MRYPGYFHDVESHSPTPWLGKLNTLTQNQRGMWNDPGIQLFSLQTGQSPGSVLTVVRTQGSTFTVTQQSNPWVSFSTYITTAITIPCKLRDPFNGTIVRHSLTPSLRTLLVDRNRAFTGVDLSTPTSRAALTVCNLDVLS